MASEVGICNSALSKIGSPTRITSLTEGSRAANACNEQYAKIRDALLRSHTWNFATKRAKLAQSSEIPEYEFNFAYRLPADWLRTVAVHDNDAGVGDTAFRIEGRKLITNANELYLRYIRRVTDPNDMPADFREALAVNLAVELAILIAQSNSLKESLKADQKTALRRTRSTDAIEDYPEAFPEGNWITSRY